MKWLRPKKDRIYLDYAAATPVSAPVLMAMKPYFSKYFANPSAIHSEGIQARQAVEIARGDIAHTLGVRSSEVLFTGSGSESNNLAIMGYLKALHIDQGIAYEQMKVISTKIEHPSVLEVLSEVMRLGVMVEYVDVDQYGVVVESSLKDTLCYKTRLVTFSYANSEIGVVQSVKRLSRIIAAYNKANGVAIKIHLDASQAPLWLPCQLLPLGVDLMTLDAGKCQGPKGVGILIKRSVPLRPIVLGGGQESGLRAGTENTPLIVGAAQALVLAQSAWQQNNTTAGTNMEELLQRLRDALPAMVLNGPEMVWTTKGDVTWVGNRLPNNINISLPGLDTEFAVVTLDAKGIAASTKSACSGAGGGASGVVQAISQDTARAMATIRFSCGPKGLPTTAQQKVTEVLQTHVAKMQSFDSSAN